MICKIFEWAWKSGLEVELSSEIWARPYYEQGRFLPREEVNYTTHGAVVKEMPVLTFRRHEKNYKLRAKNWAEMVAMLEHLHRKIAYELCIEPFIE